MIEGTKNYLEKRLKYLSQKQDNSQEALFRLETGMATIPVVALVLLARTGLSLAESTKFLKGMGWALIAYIYLYMALDLYFQHRTQEYDAMCKETLNYICLLADPKYDITLECEELDAKMKSSSNPFSQKED